MSKSRRNSGLSPRAVEILDAVVQLNIETGRPVSSGLVERFLLRAVSSATIRSVMKNLEEAGYLEQPHTSAGRLPTDAGFRTFVDGLRAGWSLRRHDLSKGFTGLGEPEFDPASERPADLKGLARLLCRLTDNIGIIVGPSLDTVQVLRVEVFPRTLRRLLLVLTLDNGIVRTGLIDLDRDTPAHVACEAGRLLSEKISGLTVGELRRGALDAVDLAPNPVTRCARDLAERTRDLVEEGQQGEIEYEGVTQVIEQPEFHEPEPLKALIRFIQSPRDIREALGRLGPADRNDLGVWIGGENPVGGLRRFTVVTGHLDLDGRSGMLAVVGPRRMPYQRAFRGIEILRRAAVDADVRPV
jgi:heat-inducible transcriptional repressor